MIKKLRRRFVLINMAIVTAMLLIIFSLFINFTAIDLQNKSEATLQKLLQPAADPDNLFKQVSEPYIVVHFTPMGELIHGRTHYDLENTDFLNQLLEQVDVNAGKGFLDDYNMIYAISTGYNYKIVAFLDVSGNASTVETMLYISLIVGLVALIAFAIISVLLARWAVKPVDKAWKQQKQFVSDASHELKTPLTVIMSNAELLNSPDLDPDGQNQFCDNILSASKQMRHLVESLLELARADNGQIKTSFEQTDFSKIIADGILPFEPVFYENNMALESRIEPNIQVNGSTQYLRQLIDILLDNAQKYSSPGIVDVTLRRQSRTQCVLTVSNPGTPIPEDELENIFGRFYRSDTARSNNGSFGLGLSIAQRIAEEHGGDIWAESNPTGNRFTVLLPCLPQ